MALTKAQWARAADEEMSRWQRVEIVQTAGKRTEGVAVEHRLYLNQEGGKVLKSQSTGAMDSTKVGIHRLHSGFPEFPEVRGGGGHEVPLRSL